MSAEEFLGMWLALTLAIGYLGTARCLCFLCRVLCSGSRSRTRSRLLPS